MPGPTKYAVRFVLLDPVRMAATGSIERSVIMTITGLVQGDSDDLSVLNAREGARLISRNLIRLTHFRTVAEAMIREANENKGVLICRYCSRCGRKFRTNDQCQQCGISFRLDGMDGVVSQAPGIPAKVVAYAKAQKHTFMHEPPRS